jgi:outer membrane receptor protein involved in Fe transport
MCVLATAAAGQQAGSIQGVVRDADFDAPLPLAEVLVLETGQKATTGDAGNYLLTNVPEGVYTITITKDGYTTFVRGDVAVQPGQPTQISASLTGDFEDMEEFIVQDIQLGLGTEAGLLQLRVEAPSLLDSIGSEMLSKAGASDAADAIKLISGATVQDGKFAVIRGLPDRYVNSQLNGVRLPSADDETRAVELDQFPTAVIESIQVSKTFTPDQQGDASGGAVNVVLKGIPSQNLLQFSSSYSMNTKTSGRKDFLSYEGGGLSYFGFNANDQRQIQSEWNQTPDNLDPASPNDGFYDGAVGVSRTHAPIDYKWALTGALNHQFDNGVRVGGMASFFYERDSQSVYDGLDDDMVVDPTDSTSVVPTRGSDPDDYTTSLFDVQQSSQEVKWGGLLVGGLEADGQELKVVYLYTRSAQDTVTLAENTRGKAMDFPGYDPNDATSPGFFDFAKNPWLRQETLDYAERTTQTLQFSGLHRIPLFDEDLAAGPWQILNPEAQWLYALNEATFYQPDKRLFASYWYPGFSFPGITIPPRHGAVLPGNNINLGNLQRTFRDIAEYGEQLQLSAKFPFRQWTETEGYVKVGYFQDRVHREYFQETFSNPTATDSGTDGRTEWNELWSGYFPEDLHYVTASVYDSNYNGTFDVDATYWMIDLPVTSWFKVVGGFRYENTKIRTNVDPDLLPNGTPGPVYFPPGSQNPTALTPNAVNRRYSQEDMLPAIAFVWDVLEGVTLRGSYSQTVARQTFRELTPIQQQEYLGGKVFVGNPDLRMAALNNYDLRLDIKPTENSLISVSYFLKDIEDAIEYINQSTADQGVYTTPTNYPSGRLSGWEFEVRQELSDIWDQLAGFSIGGNATLIDSNVRLPQFEIAAMRNPALNLQVRDSRHATNAPELLYNAYATYFLERTGTELAVFYTVRGDTLVSGGGIGNDGYIPDVYETEYGTLNMSVSQTLGKYFKLKFQAKNLLDPEIQEVYRYRGQDTVKTSLTKGIDLSFSLSAKFEF